jgi:hypothetical protein
MVEERITEVETPTGNTHTTHTVVHDSEPRRSGAGWLLPLILIAALIGGFLIFSNMSESEAVKDTAIADAANNVGEAAQNVGDAAQDAVNNNN